MLAFLLLSRENRWSVVTGTGAWVCPIRPRSDFRSSFLLYHKTDTYAGQIAVVAVLQFQNRFYDSQKLTLYLYINIEVFLGYGKAFRELQHCNAQQICLPFPEKNKKNVSSRFVDRNEKIVPLHRQ